MNEFQKQIHLFDSECSDSEPTGIIYSKDFILNPEKWFNHLQAHTAWNHQYQSRKTATFGVTYNYRKGTLKRRPMPEFLQKLCRKIESEFNYLPNNCLINYYPSGDHYISFHSDQDMDMKAQSGVTIVSLGAIRNMVLRQISSNQNRHYYPLQPGSAFFMPDQLQKEWQHGVLKEAGAGPRISLSFRALKE